MKKQDTVNPNALTKQQVAKLLNGSRVVAHRRAAGLPAQKAKCTTGNTVAKWIEAGLPQTAEGKLSLIDVAAWLACERKDNGGGRKSSASKAAGKGGGKANENLAEKMRKHVEEGDIVSLIGLLMESTDDLPTAEAVSKIVVNVINAEKGRVKAQSDEYERRIRAGELLEANEVEQGYVERARFIRDVIDKIPQRAMRLVGKTLIEIREELEQISNELLQELSGDQ